MGLTLMEGNEAIARAALAAGCRFFAGYPITPATTIYAHMLKLLPPAGGICLQGEDEIASIGYCLGASMAGLKAMTATSGPGISLFSEQISFAVGSEIPIVIIDVQRLGPSTGSATKGADGDIQFLRWGSSGGIPVIVLAPVDIKDCYELTLQAFNLAERFRCPVFLASNKEISMTRETLDLSRVASPKIINRTYASDDRPYLPFDAWAVDVAPPFLPLGAGQLVRQTSSTHGPDGYITVDAERIAVNNQRLVQKIEKHQKMFQFYEFHDAPVHRTLLITYGVTARAVRAALAESRHRRHAAVLVLKTLWPVPEKLIRATAADFERIVVVEMNMGQYVREIQRVLPAKKIDFLGQMNGELVRPRQITEVLECDKFYKS